MKILESREDAWVTGQVVMPLLEIEQHGAPGWLVG